MDDGGWTMEAICAQRPEKNYYRSCGISGLAKNSCQIFGSEGSYMQNIPD
jgi:hypothetical protein